MWICLKQLLLSIKIWKQMRRSHKARKNRSDLLRSRKKLEPRSKNKACSNDYQKIAILPYPMVPSAKLSDGTKCKVIWWYQPQSYPMVPSAKLPDGTSCKVAWWYHVQLPDGNNYQVHSYPMVPSEKLINGIKRTVMLLNGTKCKVPALSLTISEIAF